MGKGNGKPLDVEHELPPAEDPSEEAAATPAEQAQADEMQRLAVERAALYERLARQQAEFENLRKRMGREQQEFRDYAAADSVRQMLPILDSLERALAHAKKEESELAAGVDLIRRQMLETLRKLGVEEIAAAGEHFDPQWHQAVEVVESDEVEDNHVLEVLQRGFRLKDRLLRPAMVRVARRSQ